MCGQLVSSVIRAKSGRKRVSGPQLMLGCESRISRSRVVPEPWQPTMKMGRTHVSGMHPWDPGGAGLVQTQSDERALGPARWRWGPLPDAYQAEWEASGRSFALLAGLGWKVMMDAYASASALVPDDRWLDVRFEDLLTDPVGRCKEIVEFLGLGWE